MSVFCFCLCVVDVWFVIFFFFILFQYEDPVRQEAARKTVPEDELEEKALVSLAKVWPYINSLVNRNDKLEL